MAKSRKPKNDKNPEETAGTERSHPVGVGMGAAGGAATGAAIGAVGGPAGVAIGAAVGGIAGGLAGKAAAEAINPKEEEDYWREHFRTRPYAGEDADYSTYAPAYRYGWEASTRHHGRSFEDVESDLGRGWSEARGESSIEWDRAKHAARDAWQRVHERAAQPSSERSDRQRVEEERYWRENYASRPYVDRGAPYDTYAPAYRFGWESRDRYRGRAFDDAEQDLRRDWETRHAGSSLSWERAKEAVRDAWHRVERALPGDADRDGR